MEGKKRVVPGEVCAERAERRNHDRKVMLNAQKSAEAIVPCKEKYMSKRVPAEDTIHLNESAIER